MSTHDTLRRYFSEKMLRNAWEHHQHIGIQYNQLGKVQLVPLTERGRRSLTGHVPPESFHMSCFDACLGKFMKDGPVIIRPSLDMCKAMIDTTLNFSVEDYMQPFPLVGIELPLEVSETDTPSLMVLWRHNNRRIMMASRLQAKGEDAQYVTTIDTRKPTLEDWLDFMEEDDSKEGRLLAPLVTRAVRLGMNLCVLAMSRPTKTIKLPPQIERNRRAANDGVRERAARHVREIVFRDLMIAHRPDDPIEPDFATTGVEQGRQHRRNHWRRVAYGPKHSLRRWQLIGDYWTKPEQEGEPPPTIILT